LRKEIDDGGDKLKETERLHSFKVAGLEDNIKYAETDLKLERQYKEEWMKKYEASAKQAN
jgi:hypothetical protein